MQVDPSKPKLKAPRSKRLKVHHDHLLSSFAPKFNLRRYTEDMSAARVRPNERTFAHLTWGYGQLDDVAGITQSAQLMARAYTRPLLSST